HLGDATDAYGKALLANTLAAADPNDAAAQGVIAELVALAESDNGATSWPGRGSSITYSKGDSLRLETTALVVYALLKAGAASDAAQGALTYIVRNKNELGNWHSTQGTVLALKSLLASVQGTRQPVNATVG